MWERRTERRPWRCRKKSKSNIKEECIMCAGYVHTFVCILRSPREEKVKILFLLKKTHINRVNKTLFLPKKATRTRRKAIKIHICDDDDDGSQQAEEARKESENVMRNKKLFDEEEKKRREKKIKGFWHFSMLRHWGCGRSTR